MLYNKHGLPTLSVFQESYLKYVKDNPGCCIADVYRACTVRPGTGYGRIHAGVQRLLNRGLLVKCTPKNPGHGRIGLKVAKKIKF